MKPNERYDASNVEQTAEYNGIPTWVRVFEIPDYADWQIFIGYNAMDEDTPPPKRFYVHVSHPKLIVDEEEIGLELGASGDATMQTPDALQKALGDETDDLVALAKQALETYAALLFLRGETT